MNKFICPICDSKHYVKKYKIMGYNLLQCSECGVILLEHGLSFLQIKRIYKKHYFNNKNSLVGYIDYFSIQKGLEQTFKNRLKAIQILKNPTNLLDVGTSTGIFLKVCNDVGINAQGIELSDEAVKYARNTLGVSVTHTSLEEFVSNEKFDTITSWDVVEHIYSPNSFFDKVYELLADGGYFVFTTGNIESLVAKISGKRWHLFNLPDHIFFYSEKTIARLLNKHKFKVIRISYPHSVYNLSYLLERFMKTVLRVNNPKLIYSLAYNQIFRNLVIPFNLFDIMQVVAVKVTDDV